MNYRSIIRGSMTGFVLLPIVALHSEGAPFLVCGEGIDPGLTTHTLTSGTVQLGISEYGGGYINQLILPGKGDLFGPTSAKYGRGGQTAIRDLYHGGKYNPTQAGFHDYAGTHCEINVTGNRLEVPTRPCAGYRGDGQFDFTEWEDLVDDLYSGDGGNSDGDGIDESSLPGKQADEVTTEFDFACSYSDEKGSTGMFFAGNDTITIPSIRHYFEYTYERDPGHCIRQHDVRMNTAYANVTPAVSSPAGLVGVAVDTNDLACVSVGLTLRLDRDVWTPQYVCWAGPDDNHLSLRFAARTNRTDFNVYQNDVGDLPGGFETSSDPVAKPLLILADSTDPNAGGALGLYFPPSQTNDFSVTGEGYEDRRTAIVTMSDEPERAVNMDKFGFYLKLSGLFNPTRLTGPEKLRGEMYILYGTPKQIYMNAQRLSNQAPTFTTDALDWGIAFANLAFNETISDTAADLNHDPLTYSKVSGPAWLNVAADGTLSGTPGPGDAGLNVFTVRVDALGGSDTATLSIEVSTGTPVNLFTDGFESGDFSAGAWTVSGNCEIGTTYPQTGLYCAQINQSDVLTKSISTVDMSHILLVYSRRCNTNLDPGEYLVVEWSPDGSVWNLVEETADKAYATVVWKLPAGAEDQPGFQVRFRMTSDAINEWGWVDDVYLDAISGAGNIPPAFNGDPVVEVNAEEGVVYSGTLSNDATDADGDPLFFSLISGPSWLSVATDGALSGTPGAADLGLNTWTVRVTDGEDSDTASLEVTVGAAPSSLIVADAYVNSGAPTANYGSDLNLRLQSHPTSEKIAYLKFDVTGGSISSATLRLYSVTVGASVSVYAVADTTWTENGLTWNNRPALGALLSTTTCADDTWCDWDVSNYVSGAGTYTFALVSNEIYNDRFRSSEHALVPVLNVSGGGQ